MNLKLSIPATIFAATSVLGAMVFPFQSTSAQPLTPTPTEIAPEIIQYECFDSNGKIALTTVNPQDTYGWALGCREVPYINNDSLQSQVVYYQCFDTNGNIALTTVDENKADAFSKAHDLTCRSIGKRDSSPVQAQAIYYECLNTSGQVAFTTAFPQDTYGWKPGCREMISRTLPQIISPPTPQ